MGSKLSLLLFRLPGFSPTMACIDAQGIRSATRSSAAKPRFGARFPGFVAERLDEWVGIAKLFGPHSRRP
jgi:hypothetical protein